MLHYSNMNAAGPPEWPCCRLPGRIGNRRGDQPDVCQQEPPRRVRHGRRRRKGGRCTSKADATNIAQEAGEATSEWLGQAAARATSKHSNLSGIGLRGLDGLAAAAVGVKGGEAFGGEITAFAQRSIETGVDAATGALSAGSLTEAAAAQAAEAHFEAVAVEGARLQALGLTFATESIRVCNAHAKAVFEDPAK